MQSQIQRWILTAIAAAGLAACHFGDDRNHGGDDDPVEACGDGAVDAGENCDDENTADGDGCDGACAVEAGWSCTGEPSTCTMGEGECGDGAISSGEECDDDDTESGDGCDEDCVVEDGWECSGAPSQCERTCSNGSIDPGEECDDGDAQSGDGCSAICDVEPGWECTGVPSVCTAIACTLVPQNGCPANKACDLTAALNGDTECRDVTGNGTSDSLCNATVTSCSAGYTCVEIDNDTAGCMKYCGGDGNCAGLGSRCVNTILDLQGDPIPGVKVCSNACDPLDQTGCPNGLGCLPFDLAGGDITDCDDMGTRADGQSCSRDNDCRIGSVCVSTAGGGAVCRSMCEVGVTFCGSGLTCVGFVDVIVLGGSEIGACL